MKEYICGNEISASSTSHAEDLFTLTEVQVDSKNLTCLDKTWYWSNGEVFGVAVVMFILGIWASGFFRN